MRYLLDPSFAGVADAIARFLAAERERLPPPVVEALEAAYPSPVDRLVNTVECLWAYVADLSPDGVRLCGQLADVAQLGRFHTLGQTSRADQIIQACRRMLGELTDTDAPPGADPAASDRFRR